MKTSNTILELHVLFKHSLAKIMDMKNSCFIFEILPFSFVLCYMLCHIFHSNSCNFNHSYSCVYKHFSTPMLGVCDWASTVRDFSLENSQENEKIQEDFWKAKCHEIILGFQFSKK